jgi:acyl carrier protein
MSETQPTKSQVEAIVLEAIRRTNLARDEKSQLEVSATAPLYSPASTLDSLSLVTLLIDIEEGLLDAGCEVSLSDERAMSQQHSPFRDVPTLVAYIQALG